ncbi:MAG: tRNA dihydrouridine(20/20a) synthase DusA [Proteobacteria bacterium]|nr:tRNA dihydrouridine(20/20a) synthase DusA [Pseudomonadota bacterium]
MSTRHPQKPQFSVAPMMDWTDRHCRVFHRVLTRHALLYTEMVTEMAVRHGDRDKLLGFDVREQPVALQLGGSSPKGLAEAARIGEQFGYVEINLNVGCPSDKVQEGRFGACLMAEPALVADCVAAMRAAVRVPVTVKCRIGIDDQDEEEALQSFVEQVAQAGCETFIVHARKAWLKGLSPKENREIPPLNYDRVHRLKASFPKKDIILNGGMSSPAGDFSHLIDLDGLMYGRAAYQTPWILADVDRLFTGEANPVASRRAAVEAMLPYVREQVSAGLLLHRITRHMLGLYHAQPGGRLWRQILSQDAVKPGADASVLVKALDAVEAQAARMKDAA